MALSDYVVITEKAVANSEVSHALNAKVRRISVSSDVDTELRIGTGGAGYRIAGDAPGKVIENANNWAGATIYVWSTGTGTVHIMEEIEVVG